MKTYNNFDDEEQQNRLDLAAAYHLADIFGFSDINWNHSTCTSLVPSAVYARRLVLVLGYTGAGDRLCHHRLPFDGGSLYVYADDRFAGDGGLGDR